MQRIRDLAFHVSVVRVRNQSWRFRQYVIIDVFDENTDSDKEDPSNLPISK